MRRRDPNCGILTAILTVEIASLVSEKAPYNSLYQNYKELYGALRDTYSASPLCLLMEQRIFHSLGDPMYTTGSSTVVFCFCLSRVYAILLYYTCALIKLLIDILFSIFATFPYTMR